jgi:hypothetical protein
LTIGLKSSGTITINTGIATAIDSAISFGVMTHTALAIAIYSATSFGGVAIGRFLAEPAAAITVNLAVGFRSIAKATTTSDSTTAFAISCISFT